MRVDSIVRVVKKHAPVLLLTAVFCLAGAGLCWAAAGDEVTWKATDTQKVFNFLVLAAALYLIVRKPATDALNGRIKGIREELVSLERKKEEARKTLEEFTEKLAALDKESEKIIDEYQRQGEEIRNNILGKAREAAQKIEEQAQKNIENEFEAAKKRLQQEIFAKAVIRAEMLVKDNITADDQDRLVDEYLNKVVLQ